LNKRWLLRCRVCLLQLSQKCLVLSLLVSCFDQGLKSVRRITLLTTLASASMITLEHSITTGARHVHWDTRSFHRTLKVYRATRSAQLDRFWNMTEKHSGLSVSRAPVIR
jgi:hypothetical protein